MGWSHGDPIKSYNLASDWAPHQCGLFPYLLCAEAWGCSNSFAHSPAWCDTAVANAMSQMSNFSQNAFIPYRIWIQRWCTSSGRIVFFESDVRATRYLGCVTSGCRTLLGIHWRLKISHLENPILYAPKLHILWRYNSPGTGGLCALEAEFKECGSGTAGCFEHLLNIDPVSMLHVLLLPSLKLTVRPRKWMVGIRSFPFGARPTKGLLLLVSGRIVQLYCEA